MLLTKHFIINRESSLEHVQGTQNVTHGQYHSPTKAPTMAPVVTCVDDLACVFVLNFSGDSVGVTTSQRTTVSLQSVKLGTVILLTMISGRHVAMLVV
jgi:hypothetical protein